MSETFYLIDGHAQIYRAYYAPFRDLTSPSGEPTRATYVFMSMLFKLLQERRPVYWAVALDSDTASAARQEVFADYKATRDPTPEDLIPQIRRIEELLGLLEIPVLKVPGYEADDIIATVARRLRDQDVDIFVVGKDKDLEQLITDRVCLFDPGKDQVIDAGGLEQAKGYRPDQVIEIQTLMGDKVDNIPGIPGVGIKTAARLIHQYGNAAGVVEHADELTPKLKNNVKAFAENLQRTRELVTLRDDLAFEFDLPGARYEGVFADALRTKFRDLGFNRLVDTLDKLEGPRDALAFPVEDQPPAAAPTVTAALPRPCLKTVDTPALLSELAEALDRATAVAIGFQTLDGHALEARLAGVSICYEAGKACYVPLCAAMGETLPEPLVLQALTDVLSNPDCIKVGENLKVQQLLLGQRRIDLAGPWFDTLIASFVLDPLRRAHDVSFLAQEFFNHHVIPVTDLLGKGRDRMGLDQVDSARAAEFYGERIDLVWRSYQHMHREILNGPCCGLFENIEMPLQPVLAAMERRGVVIDLDLLAQIGGEFQTRLEGLAREIHDLAGHAFNIDSPKQLAEVLFDELGLRVVRKTKTGRSTDAESLATIAEESDHVLPQCVLSYRELVKLKNTYTDSLPRMVLKSTGRIHASFNTTGAVTGRLSSNEPNMQNIPVRTATGREIRKAFVASGPDTLLLAADYSQIELRLLAHFCQDEHLLRAFARDEDIHRSVAAEVFDLDPQAVDSEQRRAKAVNFGIIYGQTPFGLARGTGMTVGEAGAFINLYFMRYPGIRQFIDSCVEQAERDGYVSTLGGRRRPILELRSRNRQKRQLGERLAVNTVLQGSAADLIKLAMIRIEARQWPDDARPQMLIQVHDELIFEVGAAVVETAAEGIVAEMTQAMDLQVPLKVDVAWGPSWFDCK